VAQDITQLSNYIYK